ncbi:response regulator transcription factor [Aquihabitans sp. G128]|uniref:response regulator n=1 Tax=Aquihabitans sp. G128 TaxID=2849779 RepID=UPI001C21FEED|nr:response regulator transcription factor [Aquihabitans sp. G128]QXC62374.1 response regulator transcription factor [Aquihabitans sp. G128]
MIRVLIADDHAVVRGGLEQLLATTDDLELVGLAADGEEAVSLARSVAPDVVLMDLSMPGLDGVAATRAITAADGDVAVVVLTSFSDKERILAALDAGAVGYVLKHAAPDEVLDAVRAAHGGGSPLDPKAARVLLDRQRGRPGAGSGGAKLSDREVEVLRLVAEGLANKLIARRLGITERTVKAHLTNVFSRIGVTDRTQAALWARDHLPPESPG